MTQDKAREFFSAFQEGTLEPGLRASLERKFAAEDALRLEYDAFVATVAALDALRSEAIETPSYLSDRISARIDTAHVPAAPFWASWFGPRTMASASPRFVWATGLAACMLLGAVGLRGMQSENSQSASILSGAGSDGVSWSEEADGVTATFAPGRSREISVTPQDGASQTYRLADRQRFELTLTNPSRSVEHFEVTSGGETLATVFVPGNRRTAHRTSSGTLEELATALADTYRITVVVKSGSSSPTVRWNLDGTDAYTAAKDSLGNAGSATLLNGNVLKINR